MEAREIFAGDRGGKRLDRACSGGKRLIVYEGRRDRLKRGAKCEAFRLRCIGGAFLVREVTERSADKR